MLAIEYRRDNPDTVYVYVEKDSPSPETPIAVVKAPATHSAPVAEIRSMRRGAESFDFDPNTVSVGDLCRLGFSPKQAASIDNYRKKGGRFLRKEDFSKSYVVSDTIYNRLEPYIKIPKLDINSADSAQFDALPGIGPYFASRMVSHRTELGGYSSCLQLLDIYHFDRERYDAIADLIYCSAGPSFDIWHLPEDSLRAHPYIKSREVARSIVMYRERHDSSDWTLKKLLDAEVIDTQRYEQLCRLGCENF